MSKIGDVVNRAREAFNSGRTRPLQFRIQQLEALQRMITEHQPEITAALASDLHKVRVPGWAWGAGYKKGLADTTGTGTVAP